MGKKLEVKICTGTMCYVMGGADLQLLDEHLSKEILDQIDIKGAPCLSCCNKDDKKAPFVLVGDEVLSEASINSVVNEIKRQLGL